MKHHTARISGLFIALTIAATAATLYLTTGASGDEAYSANINATLQIVTEVHGLTPGDVYVPVWKYTADDNDAYYYLGGNARTVKADGTLRIIPIAIVELTQGKGYVGGTYEVMLCGPNTEDYAVPAIGPDGLPLEYEIEL